MEGEERFKFNKAKRESERRGDVQIKKKQIKGAQIRQEKQKRTAGQQVEAVKARLIYGKIGGCASAGGVVSSLAGAAPCTNTAGSRRRGTGDGS